MSPPTAKKVYNTKHNLRRHSLPFNPRTASTEKKMTATFRFQEICKQKELSDSKPPSLRKRRSRNAVLATKQRKKCNKNPMYAADDDDTLNRKENESVAGCLLPQLGGRGQNSARWPSPPPCNASDQSLLGGNLFWRRRGC